MASLELRSCVNGGANQNSVYLQKFRLYETCSSYYLTGRNKSRTCWRVLKIDRLEPLELNVVEDLTTYSENECFDLLRRLDEGNQATGGLKFLKTCYGIIGFVRFLGPYYMLIITKRRKLGEICGHAIYGIAKSEMIPIPNTTVRSNLPYYQDENRYKKLLCSLDLTKDFYFSYSYHVMRSLQKNLSDYKTGQFVYETMFVWNEYLTHGIRHILKNTLWTVALVYGFFKEVELSVSGKNVKLTLIARRSRHYAGTRYLKRGVNEKGRVANDVETEQIVTENVSDGWHPMQISSVVQNRGSIPLFWSHETSRLNIKPDIRLSRKDHNYEATRLHFENLVNRYGNPIIILNLIKTREKKPRETILRAEFVNAIRFLNRSLPKENRLRFLHWDLHKLSRSSKATNVLGQLGDVAAYALSLTGIFYCQVTPNLWPVELSNVPCFEEKSGDCSSENLSSINAGADNVEVENCNDSCRGDTSRNYRSKPVLFQKGVLRTNCIDCLDRTNVAQYAYGLVSLGLQLHALGFIESPKIDLDDTLAKELMGLYETMGDTLALQYGGSAAHNKIFSERRGQWGPATQSQEFIRTIQRFYNNNYWDFMKQDAINLFLGHFQPQTGKPSLWELNSDQHYDLRRLDSNFADGNIRSVIKRSLSDGNILCESDTPKGNTLAGRNQPSCENTPGLNECLSDSTPVISTRESDISYCRYLPSVHRKQLFRFMPPDERFLECDHISYEEHDDKCNFSNFMDADWLSSSANSCEDDTCDRSSPSLSSDNIASEPGLSAKPKSELKTNGVRAEYPESFSNWVNDGGLLFH
ncbi:hypothetical protein UlMin_015851 [Ulmus minor]